MSFLSQHYLRSVLTRLQPARIRKYWISDFLSESTLAKARRNLLNLEELEMQVFNPQAGGLFEKWKACPRRAGFFPYSSCRDSFHVSACSFSEQTKKSI